MTLPAFSVQIKVASETRNNEHHICKHKKNFELHLQLCLQLQYKSHSSLYKGACELCELLTGIMTQTKNAYCMLCLFIKCLSPPPNSSCVLNVPNSRRKLLLLSKCILSVSMNHFLEYVEL